MVHRCQLREAIHSDKSFPDKDGASPHFLNQHIAVIAFGEISSLTFQSNKYHIHKMNLCVKGTFISSFNLFALNSFINRDELEM